MKKHEKAKELLSTAESLGCKAKLDGNWVTFTPPLPTSLIIEAAKLGNELAELLRNSAEKH